jgi:hypothetical protein
MGCPHHAIGQPRDPCFIILASSPMAPRFLLAGLLHHRDSFALLLPRELPRRLRPLQPHPPPFPPPPSRPPLSPVATNPLKPLTLTRHRVLSSPPALIRSPAWHHRSMATPHPTPLYSAASVSSPPPFLLHVLSELTLVSCSYNGGRAVPTTMDLSLCRFIRIRTIVCTYKAVLLKKPWTKHVLQFSNPPRDNWHASCKQSTVSCILRALLLHLWRHRRTVTVTAK